MRTIELLDTIRNILSERGRSYGPASRNLDVMAGLANVMFASKLKDGAKLTKIDMAIIMILAKLSRIEGAPDGVFHIDNPMDIVGFSLIAAELMETEARANENGTAV